MIVNNTFCTFRDKYIIIEKILISIRDITYKTPENFFGHLVALDHEIGGIFARSVHLKLPEKFSGHLMVSFSRDTRSNTYFYKKIRK